MPFFWKRTIFTVGMPCPWFILGCWDMPWDDREKYFRKSVHHLHVPIFCYAAWRRLTTKLRSTICLLCYSCTWQGGCRFVCKVCSLWRVTGCNDWRLWLLGLAEHGKCPFWLKNFYTPQKAHHRWKQGIFAFIKETSLQKSHVCVVLIARNSQIFRLIKTGS